MPRRINPLQKDALFCSSCRTWHPKAQIVKAQYCNGNRQVRYTCVSCNALIKQRNENAR